MVIGALHPESIQPTSQSLDDTNTSSNTTNTFNSNSMKKYMMYLTIMVKFVG